MKQNQSRYNQSKSQTQNINQKKVLKKPKLGVKLEDRRSKTSGGTTG